MNSNIHITPIESTYEPLNYSLTEETSKRAFERGLAEADWYTSPVPREEMQKLLVRKDWPALRDTAIWLGLLLASAGAVGALWGSWWSLVPLMSYWILYASVSDSRWHEAGHGTAFKTDWMNNALYEVASFMVMREPMVWRWSHTRHHSDTIIVGRDPEIASLRPPKVASLVRSFFNLDTLPKYFSALVTHSLGKIGAEERMYLPGSAYESVFAKARITLLVYLAVWGSAIGFGSWLPLMLVGLPNLLGAWLVPFYGLTQHAGLEQNVLDHRKNCRTIEMGLINRFLYWNMNYHVEHHMFPLVPYHALPRLHALIKADMPAPYASVLSAWQEIIPTLRKQRKDPTYCVVRPIPAPASAAKSVNARHLFPTQQDLDSNGWLRICEAILLKNQDVIRVDYQASSYAVYRNEHDDIFATDGFCTHGNTHLSTGLVIGNTIECPKHNGRFDVTDGTVQRPPVCVNLLTHKVVERDGCVYLQPKKASPEATQSLKFVVASNRNVATFIKEVVLQPLDDLSSITIKPGDYLQIDIPPYEEFPLSDLSIDAPFEKHWVASNLYAHRVKNPLWAKRNYSIANIPDKELNIKLNVRIGLPPNQSHYSPGIGSSYIFNLKPGDIVHSGRPVGDFHIKKTDREMVYIGGGAGMAPLKAHISHLFETLNTSRKVSYWYGARSFSESFYQEYFNDLATQWSNFKYALVLSEDDGKEGCEYLQGFVHDAVYGHYLKSHPNLADMEFYLCGPPIMIESVLKMLAQLGVPDERIAFDAFN